MLSTKDTTHIPFGIAPIGEMAPGCLENTRTKRVNCLSAPVSERWQERSHRGCLKREVNFILKRDRTPYHPSHDYGILQKTHVRVYLVEISNNEYLKCVHMSTKSEA